MVATNVHSSTGARWVDQQPPTTAARPWNRRRPLQHELFLLSRGAAYAMYEASGRRLARQATSHWSGDGDGEAKANTATAKMDSIRITQQLSSQPRASAAVGPAKIISCK
jgi:hypothetical protein